MSEPTTRTLDETFQERTDALPPADFTPDRIMRAARGQQRRHRAYGTLGGVAAAGLVVALALHSGPATTSSPQPATTSGTTETSLTIDQVTRANAGFAWAMGLPPGQPEARSLGYAVVRRSELTVGSERGGTETRAERVAVVLERGEALLPPGVRAVSSPTKVADGWLFIGHGDNRAGEGGIDELGSTVVHVGEDLTVRTLVEADVVGSIFPSPDGRRVAVVTGTRSGDGRVAYDTARFVTLDSRETVQVALPDPEASAVATWNGDRVVFMGDARGMGDSRIHVYDLAERRWWVQNVPRLDGASTVALLAAPAAQGGSSSKSLVVLHGDTQACIHLMDGSEIGEEQLACDRADAELSARVSPDGRYAVVGGGFFGRVNPGPPARIIDLATGRDVAGVPAQLLDVGAFHLIWENDHALIGQAARATPVHDSATLFRWDLHTSSGESLAWDPGAGPVPHFDSAEVPPVL
jgi:hypothetical protein